MRVSRLELECQRYNELQLDLKTASLHVVGLEAECERVSEDLKAATLHSDQVSSRSLVSPGACGPNLGTIAVCQFG